MFKIDHLISATLFKTSIPAGENLNILTIEFGLEGVSLAQLLIQPVVWF
jgi:hypothetical protein